MKVNFMATEFFAGEMPPELGEVLVAIDAIALVIFFAMLYSKQIGSAATRLTRFVNPSMLLSRFRLRR